MIDEFKIATERDAPQWDWNPTDEELHELFWSKPLPTFWQQAEQSDWIDKATDFSVPLNAIYGTQTLQPEYVVHLESKWQMAPKWIVRLQSGEAWYDVEGGKSTTREAADQHRAYLQAIQPHVRFQVFRL